MADLLQASSQVQQLGRNSPNEIASINQCTSQEAQSLTHGDASATQGLNFGRDTPEAEPASSYRCNTFDQEDTCHRERANEQVDSRKEIEIIQILSSFCFDETIAK